MRAAPLGGGEDRREIDGAGADGREGLLGIVRHVFEMDERHAPAVLLDVCRRVAPRLLHPEGIDLDLHERGSVFAISQSYAAMPSISVSNSKAWL